MRNEPFGILNAYLCCWCLFFSLVTFYFSLLFFPVCLFVLTSVTLLEWTLTYCHLRAVYMWCNYNSSATKSILYQLQCVFIGILVIEKWKKRKKRKKRTGTLECETLPSTYIHTWQTNNNILCSISMEWFVYFQRNRVKTRAGEIELPACLCLCIYVWYGTSKQFKQLFE